MNLTTEERHQLEELLEPAEITKIISELYEHLKPSTHRVMACKWRKGELNNRKIQAEVIKRAKAQVKLDTELKNILA